jgi:transmembrane sensor
VTRDAPADVPGVASGRALVLGADEQVTLVRDAAPAIARGTASMAIAWTSRKIIFSRASLAEVAEEFNRYSTRQLVIEDPGAYDFHVSGVFSSADLDSIVRFLRTRPGVEVEENVSRILVRKKPT